MRTLGTMVVTLLLLARPAAAGDATGVFAPYEDVLEVVSELTWHLRDDVYRFPPPKDPTGHDIYRLSLHRLENWDKRFPGFGHDTHGVENREGTHFIQCLKRGWEKA